MSADIDTIRQALSPLRYAGKRAHLTAMERAYVERIDSAIAALERVSALQAEMEAALEALKNAQSRKCHKPYSKDVVWNLEFPATDREHDLIMKFISK